ncbi:hypothetical protein [Lysinibacillus fusiformis]|uniref:Uncharacterized protein n=1 Tax=Lysinibacillus fusiformis TaxID=28031 RepID=A0A1E4QYH7_9BACI|nr:hypothetical protein [Lysinibacillus fusiformis]ODV53229.1 hypothetical protein BG258_23285 [Lysinibacillus fusiformis]
MAKVYDLGESVLSKELLNKINGKLDETKANYDFRKTSVEITEDDLTPELRLKIQSGGGGTVTDPEGNVIAYDDTALRGRIVTLETGKMDKTEMVNYFRKDETIHEANISPDYKDKVSHQITSVNKAVSDLATSKADTAELVKYRPKSEKISEIDLSKTLYDKILSGGGGSGGGVSLEVVQTMIGDLDTKKVDKSQLNLVRKIADPITMTDVDAALQNALDSAVIAASGMLNKADKSELTLYRKIANPITLTDMDSDLASQLSIALNAANDIESFVVEYLSGAKNEIITDINNAYGQQDQLVFDFQWEITMDYYPGNEGHYTVFWALNVLYQQLKELYGKASITGGTGSVVGRVPILEGKMNTAENNITALQGRMSTAESDIDVLEKTISSEQSGSTALRSRVTKAEGKIKTLEDQVVSLETEVSSLQESVETLKSIIAALHPDIAASL